MHHNNKQKLEFYYTKMKKIWISFLTGFTIVAIAVSLVIASSNKTLRTFNTSKVLGVEKGASSPLLALGYSPLAAPINDNWPGSEIPATFPIGRSGTNIEATFQINEPALLGESDIATSWFFWTGSNSNTIYAHTCDSDFDTMLAVYTGYSIDGSTLVGENDDGCPSGSGSAVQFTPVVGQFYLFQIGGFEGAEGNYTLSLDFDLPEEGPTDTPTETPTETPSQTPSETPTETPVSGNDSFTNAMGISLNNIIDTENNGSATLEPGESDVIQGKFYIDRSLWYEFTPSITGPIEVSTCGSSSNNQSMLAVFTGSSIGSLIRIGDNNWGCQWNDHARVNFTAQAGVTYKIQLGNPDGNTRYDDISLEVRNYVVPTPPINDDFANSIELQIDEQKPVTNDYQQYTYNANGSTVEASEDDNGGQFTRSIWYHWTNDDTTREVWVDTCAWLAPYPDYAESDTHLTVYTGDTLNTLSEIASNDEWDTPSNSQWACAWEEAISFISFTAQPNETYRFKLVEISNRNKNGYFTIKTRPTEVETITDVPDGSLWCSNHGGIAKAIPYSIDDHDWDACWSWCNANMTEDMEICQMNGDGPRNCWLNYSPVAGMDSCMWVDGVYGPDTWPKGSYWGQITGYLMDLRPTLSGRLISNEAINVSFNRQRGERTIMIKDELNNTRVTDIGANFVQNLDWTSVDGDTDIVRGKAYMHNLTEAPYADSAFTLYVPIPENKVSSKVVVCPDASSSSEIYRTCPNVEVKTESDADTSIVDLDGQDFWKIEGVNSTGGYSFTAVETEIDITSNYAEIDTAFEFTVNALDSNGDVDTGYFGTVTFSSTSTNVDLPSNYTFTDTDLGTHTFTATFHELGTFTITVDDTIDTELTFTTQQIMVVNDLEDVFPCDYCWAIGFGGTETDEGYAMTTDVFGNVFMTGTFTGLDVNFNTTGEGAADLHSSNGGVDIFLTKINADGSYGWTLTIGGDGITDTTYAVTTDYLGNIYITGYFSGVDINFNTTGTGSPDIRTSRDGYGLDIFVTKINADKTYGWTRNIQTSPYSGLSKGVATDSVGNVYIAGYISSYYSEFNTTGSGPSDVRATNGTDIFLIKYTSDGGYGWTRLMGGSNGDFGTAISIDENDNIYVMGYFHSTDAEFNTTGSGPSDVHSSNGHADIFITKYNSDASYAWTRTMGGAGADIARSLAVNSSGDIYLGGTLGSAAVEFNTTGSGPSDVHSAVGATDVFLTKYNSDTSYAWTRTIGGISYDGINGVSIDSNDNVFFGGYFAGNDINFNTTGSGIDDYKSASTPDYYEIFLTKYNSSDEYVKTRIIGGGSNDRIYSTSIDSYDNLYISGTFASTNVNFNTTSRGDDDIISTNGLGDVFLVKYTDGSDSGYCGGGTPTPTPTTPVPTTTAPTTVAPTTFVPTTAVPTTTAPTTVAPTTVALTTVVPTSIAPTTLIPTTAVPTTAVPTPTPEPEILEIFDVQIIQINNGVQICWKTTRVATGEIASGVTEDNLENLTTRTNTATYENCQALTVDMKVINHYFEIIAYGTDGQIARHFGTFQIIITDLPITGDDLCKVGTPNITGSTNSGYRISFTTPNNEAVSCTISYGEEVYDTVTDGDIIGRDSEYFSTFIPASSLPDADSLDYQIVCRTVEKECSFVGTIELDWPNEAEGENLLALILGPVAQELTEKMAEVAVSTPAKTAAVGMVGLAATSFFVTNPQIFLMGMVWVYRREKNRRFGLVYDAGTKDVVPFAVIRLLDPISQRVLTETVSDLQGRYHLLGNEGKFVLEVTQDGFVKFSLPLTLVANGLQVTNNVGLSRKGGYQVNKASFKKILHQLNKYIFIIGFIFSLIVLLLNFHIINIIIVGIYLVQILILAMQKPTKNWGRVVDDKTGKPIKGVFISILDAEQQRQLDIRMSDARGRFGFILEKQQYLLKVNYQGYKVGSLNLNWKTKTLTSGEVVYEIPTGEIVNLTIKMVVDLNTAPAQNVAVQKFGNIALK